MDLSTTNLLLGIMAVVSVLEALVLIGVVVVGYKLYNRTMQTIQELEQRQVAPLMIRVNGILDDVKEVTERVTAQTERVDHAIKGTIERVDETADRVKENVRSRANYVVGVVRGVRAAIEALLAGERAERAEAQAAGRP
jgi:pyrimidine operon attenuation protein/uracil phosphoribosyltransferase